MTERVHRYAGTRALRHRHALRLRPGARRHRLPRHARRGRRPARRQRRRQVHAAQGDVRRAPALGRHHPGARRGGRRSTPRATPPTPGSRWSTRTSPWSSRRTSRPTSTSAARSCARARSAGSASSTTRRCASAPRPSSTGSASAPPPMTRPVEMLSGGQRQVVALARSAIRVSGESQRRPAARRADRGARLRADQAGRGADPPDGRPGHRDRAGHPQPAAVRRGRRPGRRPQPRPARSPTSPIGRHRDRPHRRLDHRRPRVAVRRMTTPTTTSQE